MHILFKQASNHVRGRAVSCWVRFDLTVGVVNSEPSLISSGFADHKAAAVCDVESVILGSLLWVTLVATMLFIAEEDRRM